jgi:hypothetical protein
LSAKSTIRLIIWLLQLRCAGELERLGNDLGGGRKPGDYLLAAIGQHRSKLHLLAPELIAAGRQVDPVLSCIRTTAEAGMTTRVTAWLDLNEAVTNIPKRSTRPGLPISMRTST